MFNKLLIILLTICVSSNIVYAKKKDKNTPIEVTNIFTCFDLNMATLTNGDVIYCVEDTTGEKFDYNREEAIDKINLCIKYNKIALLDLLGGVNCINKE